MKYLKGSLGLASHEQIASKYLPMNALVKLPVELGIDISGNTGTVTVQHCSCLYFSFAFNVFTSLSDAWVAYGILSSIEEL